jgi:hypothetical protein
MAGPSRLATMHQQSVWCALSRRPVQGQPSLLAAALLRLSPTRRLSLPRPPRTGRPWPGRAFRALAVGDEGWRERGDANEARPQARKLQGAGCRRSCSASEPHRVAEALSR